MAWPWPAWAAFTILRLLSRNVSGFGRNKTEQVVGGAVGEMARGGPCFGRGFGGRVTFEFGVKGREFFDALVVAGVGGIRLSGTAITAGLVQEDQVVDADAALVAGPRHHHGGIAIGLQLLLAGFGVVQLLLLLFRG